MKRFVPLVFSGVFFSLLVFAQPRFKGKMSDTTQTVLGDDTTIKKLIQFKDSVTKVGPGSDALREATESDNTALVLLIVGAVLVIVWAGRRAWKRQSTG